MIGQTLDRYLIESKLGEGGMGVVYKARDTQLGRTVAIKILPPEKVADPSRKQRFVQEAKAASALNHPGIVTIHDIRTDGDVDFMVMEYVEGKTLDQLIGTNGLQSAQALRYAIAIADALRKAHEAGIIHRDLKPSNVMVSHDDRIKILDFGLAKLVESAPRVHDATTMESPLTQQGMLLGTAAYMSPEQAEGHPVDARSDIFSFGAMLYHTVTGRKPFAADSMIKVLNKVVSDDPPPARQIAPGIPDDFEKIISRCLRKDPARRFQTAADLKAALDDVAQQPQAPVAVRREAGPRFWLVAVAAMLFAIVGWLGWREWQRPDVSAASNSHPTAIPLTSLPGVERSPSFSPDGDHVTFVWDGPKQDNRDIYVQQVGSGQPLRLTTDPINDYNPVWSPTGRWIAFLRGRAESGPNQLLLVPPLGGPERKVTDIAPRRDLIRPSARLAWCPDGTCVVVTDSTRDGGTDALFLVSLESGERRQLTYPVQAADTEPAISPDANWLVFRRSFGPFTGELYRLALRSGLTAAGEPAAITERALDANHPTWMPDSREVVFNARNSLWRLDIAGPGTPQRLPFVGDDGVTPTVSRPAAGKPARMVYVRSYVDTNIWRIDMPATGEATTSPPTLAISSTRADFSPDVSRDGRHVAFISTRSGTNEVWAADVDGSNALQVTAVGAIPGYPRWSPDGQQIAFHSNPEGQAEVWVVPATGGKPRNVSAHAGGDAFPIFSPDGEWLFFISNRAGGVNTIWKVPVRGGDALQVTRSSAGALAPSPDGKYLYYSGDGDRRSSVWRVSAEGEPEEKLVDDVLFSSFAVAERGVYYVTRTSSENLLQFYDVATRHSTTVARNIGNVTGGMTASPDGRIVLYARIDSSVDDLMLVDNFR